jgi:hypothetical protein
MLIDSTPPAIIAAHGGYEVLATAQAIVWADGSTIGLHRVQFQGYSDLFLRALQHDTLHWIVFDLRDATPPTFEAEIKTMMPIDHDGMVFYSLRLHHAHGPRTDFGARTLTACALAHVKHAWCTAAEAVPA